MITRSIIFGIALFVVFSCSSTQKWAGADFTQERKIPIFGETPKVHIFHINEQDSELKLQIPTSWLSYQETDEDIMLAEFQLSYRVNTLHARKPFLQNKSITFRDTLSNELKSHLMIQYPITLPLGTMYIIEITLDGSHNNNTIKENHLTDKRHIYTSDFFSIIKDEEHFVYPFLFSQTRQPLEAEHRYSDHFRLKKTVLYDHCPTPSPIFVESYQYNVDCILMKDTTVLPSESSKIFLDISEAAASYIFHSDYADKGFMIQHFTSKFPMPASEDFEPLRYISRNEEFSQLQQSEHPEWAIEQFWRISSGNFDRGAVLQSNYNQRVYFANLFFSSYKPGWKTDRGMVYIVVGPPSRVFSNFDKEFWEYRESSAKHSFTLEFEKKENPWGQHEYILMRKKEHQNIWNHSVSRWRR